MATQVLQRVGAPGVAQATREALAGIPLGATRQQIADAVWRWARENMELVDHEALACEMAGACSGDVQFLVDPELAALQRRGDCAIYTPLVCSMLFTAGVPCRMVVVAADRAEPRRFSHVYAAAVLEDGSLYPLDASHGQAPGWETPNQHRRAVWSVFGLRLW